VPQNFDCKGPQWLGLMKNWLKKVLKINSIWGFPSEKLKMHQSWYGFTPDDIE